MTARKPTRKVQSARAVSWATLVFGTVTSVAFNVLHVASVDARAWPMLAGVIWPVFNALGWHMLTGDWQRGRLWAFARYGVIGVAAVAAMLISGAHIYSVLRGWGEPPPTALAGPLVIDGAMLVSGLRLMDLHGRKMPSRPRTATRKAAHKAPTARRATTRKLAVATA